MGSVLKTVTGPLGMTNAVTAPTAGAKMAADKLGLKLNGEEAVYQSPEEAQAGLYRGFANDYDNQMGLAEKGVQNSGLTKDVYGEGGLQSQLATEGRNLASTGYGLQGADHEAYGQASGDISRLFGQQEQNVSQSLARRGLGSGSSGAAGAAFSGLAGNKNEMLARAQTDIAQKRMADTTQRLQANRTMQAGLANQGANLAQNRYDTKGNSLLQSVKNEATGNQERMAARAEQTENYTPGFSDALKSGLMSSVSNIGAAPGNFASSTAGAGGKAAGKGLFG